MSFPSRYKFPVDNKIAGSLGGERLDDLGVITIGIKVVMGIK